jgi:hypothetical protein
MVIGNGPASFDRPVGFGENTALNKSSRWYCMMPDDHTSSMSPESGPQTAEHATSAPAAPEDPSALPARPREIGGRDGPEPTRFGDWEKNGRCIDF